MSPVPSVITSGCTRNSATPMPLTMPTTTPSEKRERDRAAPPERSVGREQVGRACRDAGDREVDAAGQHHQRLPAAHDRERRGEQDAFRDPERRDRAGPHDLDADDESEQQQDQREDGSRAQEIEDGAHLRSCR